MKAAQLGAVGSATRGAAAGVRQQQHVAAPRRPARGRALRPLAASERDGPQVQEPAEADRAGQKEEAPGFGFNSVSGLNPLVLGRRSRAFVDSVWQRVLDLGNVGRSSVAYEDLEVLGLTSGDFEAPEASYTTVLVVGATGRVGRILVRKLLLRGYTVRALVRSPDSLDSIPRSVTVIQGDVGDYKAVREAMEGVNKVVVCMRARTTLAADVFNVEKVGMRNITKALSDIRNQKTMRLAQAAKDAAAGASHTASNGAANGAAVAAPAPAAGASGGASSSSSAAAAAADHAPDGQKVTVLRPGAKGALDGWAPDTQSAKQQRSQSGAMDDIVKRLGIKIEVTMSVTPEAALQFAGLVYLKGDSQISGPLNSLPAGATLAGREGLVLKVRGDGKRYLATLRTGGGSTGEPEQWFVSGFVARRLASSWSAVRLPFSSFRPVDPLGEALDPAKINRMGFKFESRGQPKRTDASSVLQDDDNNSYFLEVLFCKALPGGEQSDLILVSCAGAGLSEEEQAVVVPAKRTGEFTLKNSGLGYTIIRPGPLCEEPGGAKALVFDQGGRINQGIGCADVADVCLKSLHDAAARNKSFDICYEYMPEVGSMYELVAHLPDKSNNYLTPALQTLEKNT